ncbi:hypothetical protein HYW61_01455 [candidate division WWE3 bacterium]|nr:hypothetical protein [candidate division WWE3 bacterium]
MNEKRYLEKLNSLTPMRIKWEDATTTNVEINLHNIKDLASDARLAPLSTVGFLLNENDKSITVAGECFCQNNEEEYRFRKCVAIPKSFIIETTQLTYTKALTLDEYEKGFSKYKLDKIEDVTKDNVAIVIWTDASRLRDSVSRTKASVLKKCFVEDVLTTSFILDIGEKKITLCDDLNTHKCVAKEIQTIPKPSINAIIRLLPL